MQNDEIISYLTTMQMNDSEIKYEEVPLDICGQDRKIAMKAYYKTVRVLRKRGTIKTFIGGGGKELPLNDEDFAIVERHLPKNKFVVVT